MTISEVRKISFSKSQNYALTLVLTILLWEGASSAVGSRSFPHLNSVIFDLLKLMSTTLFWKSLSQTILLSLIGFAIGAIFAFAVGLAIALNTKTNHLFSSSIIFLRSIPSVVFLPLLVASIGASARSAVILTALVVALKLVIYVSRGILETEKEHLDFAKLYQLNISSRIFNIYLPSLISVVSTGFRLSASRAFGTVIAAGIIIGTPGLGRDLAFAEANAEYERVFSYVIVMGIFGTLIYSLFNLLERKFVRWRVTV